MCPDTTHQNKTHITSKKTRIMCMHTCMRVLTGSRCMCMHACKRVLTDSRCMCMGVFGLAIAAARARTVRPRSLSGDAMRLSSPPPVESPPVRRRMERGLGRRASVTSSPATEMYFSTPTLTTLFASRFAIARVLRGGGGKGEGRRARECELICVRACVWCVCLCARARVSACMRCD